MVEGERDLGRAAVNAALQCHHVATRIQWLGWHPRARRLTFADDLFDIPAPQKIFDFLHPLFNLYK